MEPMTDVTHRQLSYILQALHWGFPLKDTRLLNEVMVEVF